MFKFALVKLLCLALCLCTAPFLFAQTARPNIIFILIDDLRHDGLSATGHPYAKTPNIDRIAKEGAIFRNAFVTTPLCSPSRATFLTGQYVHKHQIVGNEKPQVFNPLSHQLKTWPRRLTSAKCTWATTTRRARASIIG
jgi:arylsulfatase A-like enzyme